MEISNGAKNKILRTACHNDMYAYYKEAIYLTTHFLGTDPERKSCWPFQMRLSQEKSNHWTIEAKGPN